MTGFQKLRLLLWGLVGLAALGAAILLWRGPAAQEPPPATMAVRKRSSHLTE